MSFMKVDKLKELEAGVRRLSDEPIIVRQEFLQMGETVRRKEARLRLCVW